MSIDFENSDARKEYLNNKLDDLLPGMEAVYGQILLDELIIRLQRTLQDFSEEIEGIMGELKDSSERRNQIIHDLMEGKDQEALDTDQDPKMENHEQSDSNTSEMSEWEKRLEGLK